jgi:unsaturated rhamnogalacturonyl hydrolase
MPAIAHGLESKDVHTGIKLLIDNLVNIKDTTGKFLHLLPDGRIIDTKSWDTNEWEWTHGIGLYGIWQYHAMTGDAELLRENPSVNQSHLNRRLTTLH